MDLNPRDLERVRITIEQISKNIERLTATMTGAVADVRDEIDDLGDEWDDTNDDIRKSTIDTIDEIERRYEDFHRYGIARIHLFGEESEKTLDRLEKKWQEYGREVQRHLSQARGPLGTAGNAMGLTSVMGGLGQLKSQLFSGMPFGMGGLLGMALWGASREEYFASAARRAVFQLQAVGGAGQKHLGQLTAQARSFYQAFGEEGTEMLGQVTSAFAEFNIAEEAFNRASISAHGFMQNITGISTAVDLMNAAAPGTTARLIGQTMQTASLGIGEASDQVFRLAASLREAKLNYGLFGAGIVQANSALRMQNQSLDDTRRLFLGLNKSFQEQGMSKQRAAAMALSGVQAATGAIGSLQPGLLGVLGQAMKRRGVEGFTELNDPVALMQRMKEGLSGAGGAFASPVFAELKEMAKKAAGTSGSAADQRGRQTFFLESMGMNFEAARAIIDGKDATDALRTPAEKSAKFTEDLNKAFATYSGRQSQFERDMRTLQDTLAMIGGDILTVLSTELVLAVEHLKMMPTVLMDMLHTGTGGALGMAMSEKDTQRLMALEQLGSKVTDIQLDAFLSMGPKFDKLLSVVSDSATRTTVGRTKSFASALLTYEQKASAPLANETWSPEKTRSILKSAKSEDPSTELEAAASAQEESAQRTRNAAAILRLKNMKRRTERSASPGR